MINALLFCLFLLQISVTNAMDIPNDLIKTLPDTLILYHFGPYLDRLDRNNFRLTDKKNSQLIIPQSLLNGKYIEACKSDNIDLMILWRKQGALEQYEEICKLALDVRYNRNILAEKLWFGGIRTDEKITTGFSYAIKHNHLLFVSWILKTVKPKYYSQEVRSALALSETLECKNINICLLNYIDHEKWYANKKESSIYNNWPKF